MIHQFRFSLVIIYLIGGFTVGILSSASAIAMEYDSWKRILELGELPERIVATLPSTTEILFELGLNTRIVAVTSLTGHLGYVPRIKRMADKKDKIGKFNISMETLVETGPDLIVLDRMAQPELLARIKRRKFPVYPAESGSLNKVTETILQLGLLTGTLSRARTIVGEMIRQKYVLREWVGKLDHRKRVLYAVSDGIYTTGGNTFLGEILQLAGLVNIFQDMDGWKKVSDEQIIKRNPELIIIPQEAGMGIQTLKNRPGFHRIEAVQKQNILILNIQETSRLSQPGTKIMDGAVRLFEKVYGIAIPMQK